MRTLTWAHTDPVEGTVPVTLTEDNGAYSLTKNGYIVPVDSPEGIALLWDKP